MCHTAYYSHVHVASSAALAGRATEGDASPADRDAAGADMWRLTSQCAPGNEHLYLGIHLSQAVRVGLCGGPRLLCHEIRQIELVLKVTVRFRGRCLLPGRAPAAATVLYSSHLGKCWQLLHVQHRVLVTLQQEDWQEGCEQCHDELQLPC